MSNMAVPVGMFMNMTNNMAPRYFQQQQAAAIQQAAKQSRNKKMPMGNPNNNFSNNMNVGGPSSSGASQGNNSRMRGRSSQAGPLTQGMSQNMMSQPGFSVDFSQNDFITGESQGDGLLSQDFANSQGPEKFYSNFQSQNF
jgi:hypothetical protein